MQEEEVTSVASVTSGAVERRLLLPAPELSHTERLGVDVRLRRIYVGEIDEGDDRWLAMTLAHFESQSRDPITIMLNTPGGDVTTMYAIHDLIRLSPVPLGIVGYGQVCSAGVLLLACGKDRAVTESCVLMSHENRLGGDEEGIGLRAAKDRRKYEDWQHAWWCELMGRYTPKDAAWWKRTTERQGEYWLLGGDAIVEAGLADRVIR